MFVAISLFWKAAVFWVARGRERDRRRRRCRTWVMQDPLALVCRDFVASSTSGTRSWRSCGGCCSWAALIPTSRTPSSAPLCLSSACIPVTMKPPRRFLPLVRASLLKMPGAGTFSLASVRVRVLGFVSWRNNRSLWLELVENFAIVVGRFMVAILLEFAALCEL